MEAPTRAKLLKSKLFQRSFVLNLISGYCLTLTFFLKQAAWEMLSQWSEIKGGELTEESLCADCLVVMCAEKKATIEAEILKKTMIYELDQNQSRKPDPNYWASKAWLFGTASILILVSPSLTQMFRMEEEKSNAE
jgi:hypothetical protein